MNKFYYLKEVCKRLDISEALAKDIIRYAFTNQKLFKVFKVNNNYLIDKRSFEIFLNN